MNAASSPADLAVRRSAPAVLTLVFAGALFFAWAQHTERDGRAPQGGVSGTGAKVGASHIGTATFYAEDFDGRPMADGELFDMNDPSIAAANNWPLGTRLRLHRVAGGPWDASLTPAEHDRYFGRTILVTVEDRGAFTHALDLSRGAFAQLGRPDEGVIQVEIERVPSAVANALGDKGR